MKSHKLPLSTRQAIAKFWSNNPSYTAAEVAAANNCTVAQARYLKQLDDVDALKKPIRKKGRRVVLRAMVDSDTDELLRKQLKYALAQLEADENINVLERVALVEKCSTIRKITQQTELAGHLKRTDASIIAAIIRRFEPDASDEQVITIYREEVAAWNSQR